MLKVIEGVFKRQTKDAAGYDMVVAETTLLDAGEFAVVPTTAKVTLPKGTVGIIGARGSLEKKKGITIFTGYLEPDYSGTIFVKVFNFTKDLITIGAGERISQCIITPIWSNPEEAEGERGESGSTGGYSLTKGNPSVVESLPETKYLTCRSCTSCDVDDMLCKNERCVHYGVVDLNYGDEPCSCHKFKEEG